MKKPKIIHLDELDRITLSVHCVKNNTNLKNYLEDVAAQKANALRVMDNIGEKPLLVSKKFKKEVIAEVIAPKKKAKKIEEFNVEGFFRNVEPRIYGNGHCFEVRVSVPGKGVQKKYYKTLKEAQDSIKQ